jgi:AAA+ superfamily predicted ATPase
MPYNDNDGFNEDVLNSLYNACEGGIIAISLAKNELDDNEYADAGAEVINNICRIMRKSRNKVQTIFCIPKTGKRIKDRLLENLSSITIVTISDEIVFDDKARAYLRSIAKEQGVTGDKALYKPIKEGRGYNSAELRLIFDKWYDHHLKTKIFTQYAQLSTANNTVAKRKPKGNAYDELSEMIGLKDAKNVIKQAINFYKAQKLFREKGFTNDCPAMHMVFTGNPGTAKTTVARLFAQIMKDNSLLSDGDLVEVGRADLVGKYVGWTAPTVKKKFRQAKGSVLFIDEAYSLVDDRDGLFGDEAINTIVQEMENNREDMVVIFAGYPDKMEGFLQKNPGLRSRIAFHVHFNDYNADELYDITKLLAGNSNLKLDECARDKLISIYEDAKKTDDFGNGRYARNILEKAIMKQASRLIEMDVDNVSIADIELLIPDDFDVPTLKKEKIIKIGFAR